MSTYRTFLALSALFLACTGSAQDPPPPKIVAHIRIVGALPESSRSMEVSPLDLMQPERMLRQRETLYSVVRRLRKAEMDATVKGVWLDFQLASIGPAQMSELRRRIEAIRAKGKKVWIHADSLSMGSLYLASAADRISVTPEGDIALSGLCVEQLFFKNALDRLKVKTQWVHTGDFKTFGESFYRNSPSDAGLAQTAALLNSLYATLDSSITASRALPRGKLRQLVDRGILTPAQAIEEKLIDAAEFPHEFRVKIRDAFEGCRFEKDYGRDQQDQLQVKGVMDLFQLLTKLSTPKTRTLYKRIKLIILEGPITRQTAEPIRRALHNAARDPRVKAVVLRINSPGGSALMSDIVAATAKLIKERRKPFIVSMGDAAASGGYYIAAPADRIFAEEASITGSIGVVAGRFVFQDALAELGITVHVQKIGKHACVSTMFTPWTPDDMKLISEKIRQTYKRFQDVVTEGRGDRIKGDLEKLAGGRVYTGADALGHGLVDEIGGIWEALEYARKQANLPEGTAVDVYPKQQSLLEVLLDPGRQTQVQVTRPALLEPFMAACRLLETRSPRKAAQLRPYFMAFSFLTKGEPLAMAPIYLY